ncbi:MAG: hydroxymethylbilane synthase [Alphaproteobacteria bacterium]|nr:hydroxymethylbilane synthase [Alphaproteobacteria bacterium]
MTTLRIGTRGSPLALIQAEEVRARLAALPGAPPTAIEIIKTTGDQIQDRTLAALGGKGLFTKEIDEALLDGRIDLAVHSMKDVPTVLPEGTVIAAHLPREDPRDALIGQGLAGLDDLKPGAVVGTASLRRAAQVLMARPDARIVPLRGNVGTRLAKIARGEAQATLLAVAGLKRLGALDKAAAVLDPEAMLPAVAQGAIGIATRVDGAVRDLVTRLDDRVTATTVGAERALLAALDGSCKTPIAALARLDGASLEIHGLIVTPDGRAWHRASRRGPAADAVALGDETGRALRAAAGPAFFAALG